MLFKDLCPEEIAGSQSALQKRVVDGFVTAAGEVWVMVARGDEDLAVWLAEDHPYDSGTELVMCRAVVDHETVVLGKCDDDDSLLSELG